MLIYIIYLFKKDIGILFGVFSLTVNFETVVQICGFLRINRTY